MEENLEKDWDEQLTMQIEPFLLSNQGNIDDKYKAKRKEQFDFVSDMLIESSAIPSRKRSNFDYKFDCEIFKVPLEDISVYNGCIYVSTKNIEFVQDASWEAFCDYLAHNNQSHLLKKQEEDKSKKIFETTKQAVLQERRKYKSIKINTFLTKGAFTEAFMNQPLEYQGLTFPFYYSNEGTNDGRYLLSQMPVCKLKEILSSENLFFQR